MKKRKRKKERKEKKDHQDSCVCVGPVYRGTSFNSVELKRDKPRTDLQIVHMKDNKQVQCNVVPREGRHTVVVNSIGWVQVVVKKMKK